MGVTVSKGPAVEAREKKPGREGPVKSRSARACTDTTSEGNSWLFAAAAWEDAGHRLQRARNYASQASF